MALAKMAFYPERGHMPRGKDWNFKEPTSSPLYGEIARSLAECQWIFAKTMPHNPHHYTLRETWAADASPSFDDVVMFIREHGYREKYSKTWYTLMNANGCKYWTMGSPLAETILINRKLLDVA
jgi:hypothetical protein